MAKIKGFGFAIWIGTGVTKTIVAGSRTCSFDDKKEQLDTSSRDGIGFLLNPSKYTLSADGVVDFVITTGYTNFTSVVNVYKLELDVNWQFGSTTNDTAPQALDTASKYFSGVGKITGLKVSSQYTGVVEYSIELSGIGDWTIT